MHTRQKRGWRLACGGIALWILTATASQALMLGMSLQQLVAESDMVVAGQVMEVRSSWTADHKSIITRANVALSEVIAGEVKERVVVVEYPGGEVDDVGMGVSDVAPLETGENVILFLQKVKSPAGAIASAGGAQVMQIVGEAQGKYSVAGGLAVKSGFTVVDPDDKVQYKVPVEELKREVRKLWASK